MAAKLIIVVSLAILGQIASVQGRFPTHSSLRAARKYASAPGASASAVVDRRGRGLLALVQRHEDHPEDAVIWDITFAEPDPTDSQQEEEEKEEPDRKQEENTDVENNDLVLNRKTEESDKEGEKDEEAKQEEEKKAELEKTQKGNKDVEKNNKDNTGKTEKRDKTDKGSKVETQEETSKKGKPEAGNEKATTPPRQEADKTAGSKLEKTVDTKAKADANKGDANNGTDTKGHVSNYATFLQQLRANGDDVGHDMHMTEFFLFTDAETISIFLIWLAVFAGLAYFYHEKILHYMPVLDTEKAKDYATGHASFKTWKFGLFALPGQALEGDGQICLWSCCCPSIRWSDTVSKAGVSFLGAEAGIDSFYRAFATMSFLYFLFFLPVAGVLVWACVAVVCAHYRMKIREAFKFPEEERSNFTFASDCITYCCCMPCAVAQEARQVHAACIVGHPCIVRPKRAAA